MDARYSAAIAVFIAGGLGTFLTVLLSQHGKLSDNATRIIKMFSAGVISSLAIVHISQEAIEELSDLDYPLGGVCILSGLLSMSIVEHLSHSWKSKPGNDDHVLATDSDIEAPLSDKPHEDSHSNGDHNHTCISNLTSTTLANVALQRGNRNKQLSLYMFEFACVFHSLIIGISLGMIHERSVVQKLTIAIACHQFLEGIGLGSMLSDAVVSKWKLVLFVVCYSLTTPLGIILGSLVDTYYIEQQHIIQGCFEGFAAGMLLYISLIQQIAEEFSKDDLHDSSKAKLKYMMYTALLCGAASMCCIALWV